jgi:hypothetical protein
MTYELTAELQGLTALVPDGRAGRLLVLLLDVRGGGLASDGETLFEPHVPCLQYGADDGWELAEGRPHYEFRCGKERYALMLLNRTRLEFAARFEDGPATVKTTGPGERIVSLREVSASPGSADVDPRCLAVPPAPIVAGRVVLPAGRVEPQGRGDDFRFGPLQGGPPPGRAKLVDLASASRWLAKLQGPLEITAFDLDRPRKRQWRLRRRRSSDVRIWIQDMELDSIVGDTCQVRRRRRPPVVADHDFEWFYELSRKKPPRRPVPFLVPRAKFGGGEGRCMHVVFNDVSEPNPTP